MTTFLVDMDGTLVDSHLVVEASWAQFAADHGLDPAAVIAHCHGRPGIATAEHFLGAGDLATRETAAMLEREQSTVEGIVEVPGAREFVAAIPDGRWALVTSANRSLALTRLAQVGIAPPAVLVTAEDIGRGKPDPEPYLLAARRMGVDASDCVVLEDSAAGVRSGLGAGCRVVVVGSLDAFDGQLRRVTDLRGVTPDDLAG